MLHDPSIISRVKVNPQSNTGVNPPAEVAGD